MYTVSWFDVSIQPQLWMQGQLFVVIPEVPLVFLRIVHMWVRSQSSDYMHRDMSVMLELHGNSVVYRAGFLNSYILGRPTSVHSCCQYLKLVRLFFSSTAADIIFQSTLNLLRQLVSQQISDLPFYNFSTSIGLSAPSRLIPAHLQQKKK
jgi:hypothetical protein